MKWLIYVLAALGLLPAGFIGWVFAQLAGNIYGGLKGAYRVRAFAAKYRNERWGHWATIKLGLRAWDGKRYRDGVGSYFQFGSIIVPVDGRDKITRDRYIPA